VSLYFTGNYSLRTETFRNKRSSLGIYLIKISALYFKIKYVRKSVVLALFFVSQYLDYQMTNLSDHDPYAYRFYQVKGLSYFKIIVELYRKKIDSTHRGERIYSINI
jgi:hypothetical protein